MAPRSVDAGVAVSHVSSPGQSGEVPAGLRLGTVLRGRYRLTSVLETGPVAAIYRAEGVDARRAVAIKIFHELGRHDWSRLELLHGATSRQASALDLPSVFLPVRDCGLDDEGRLFLVTDVAAGETLADLMQEGGLDSGRALELAILIGESLEVALNLGLVDLPLAPGDVIIEEGDRPRFRRSDLTILRRLGLADRLLAMEGPGADLRYASPEELAGRPRTERTIVYRFGVLIYELLTGSPPFSGPSPTELRQQIRRGPERLRSPQRALPASLSRLVARMVALEPLRRPADLTGGLNELWEAHCRQRPEPWRAPSRVGAPASLRSRPSARKRASRWLLAAGSVGLAAAAILAWPHLPPGQRVIKPTGSTGGPLPPAMPGAGMPVSNPSHTTRSDPARHDLESPSPTARAGLRAAGPSPAPSHPGPVASALDKPARPGVADTAPPKASSSPEPIETPPARPIQPRGQDARSADPTAIVDWLMQDTPRIDE